MSRFVTLSNGRSVYVADSAPMPHRALNTQAEPKRKTPRKRSRTATLGNASDTAARALLVDWGKLRKGQDKPVHERPCPINALLSTKAWAGSAIVSDDRNTMTVRHPSGATATLWKGAARIERENIDKWGEDVGKAISEAA